MAWPDLWPDDQLLVAALADRDVIAEPIVWDSSGATWSDYAACVIRSTWDYTDRRDDYLAWAEGVAAQTALWNPLVVLQWNTHKGYLKDLAAADVPIVQTEWLAGDDPTDLSRLIYRYGWDEIVVKPAVSAGARDTIRAQHGSVGEAEMHADGLLAAGREVMVQPYITTVDTQGELAMVFVDGEFSHAVRKGPVLVPGVDALTQASTVVLAKSTDADLDVARRALAVVPEECLYARIDLVHDADGAPMVLEVEVTEPSLFLGSDPAAAGRLAEAVVARL